jgi:hypothetical protein
MATFNGTRIGGAPGARVGVGDANALKAVPVAYAIQAALAAGDIINGPIVPKGATLLDVILDVTDLDTGGSPSITLDVGTAAAAQAFIAASTIGQTGGRARAAVIGALPVVMTADTTLQVKVNAGPATGATSGSVTVTALFLARNG